MTAGLSSRPNAGTKVAFAPPAFVGLIAAAVLAGAMIGALIATGVSSNKSSAQAAADAGLVQQALINHRADERASWTEPDANMVQQSLIQVRADERASWAGSAAATRANVGTGPTSASGYAPVAAVRPISEQEANRREHVRGPFAAPFVGQAEAQDHVGLSEKLFPISTPHPILHGPLE